MTELMDWKRRVFSLVNPMLSKMVTLRTTSESVSKSGRVTPGGWKGDSRVVLQDRDSGHLDAELKGDTYQKNGEVSASRWKESERQGLTVPRKTRRKLTLLKKICFQALSCRASSSRASLISSNSATTKAEQKGR